MLLEQLKKANMDALRNKDTIARSILSMAINKCMLLTVEKRSVEQELTENDVVNIIIKTIKEVDEEAVAFKSANRLEQYEELLKQKAVLEQYLPSMLSKEEIIEIINSLEDKSLPAVMKHFKLNYAGKCDMKLVNSIIQAL